MFTQKELLQCFPVDPLKNQIEKIATNIHLNTSDISSKTWNRYPCKLDTPKKCKNDHCNGNVDFFIKNKGIKILTLLFARENKNAYLINNRQLRSLFEDNTLKTVDSISIYLTPPIQVEPTKRVFPN